MKVVFCKAQLLGPISGADEILVNNAILLREAGHTVAVLLMYYPSTDDPYYREFTSVLPFCSEVAALSPALAEMCRERLPKTNAVCVLPVVMGEQPNGRGPHAGASAEVTFGFAARVERLKGPLVLLEAFAAACREFPHIRLRLAGDGSQRREMSTRAAALGLADRYDYVGVYSRPEERAAFMRGIDVFVMPSFTEGTPNSIIEAMAHGLPVIASRVGGIPDVLDADSG